MDRPFERKPAHLWVILGCFLVSLFCVAYPFYVIRPFRQQGPRELAVALEVLRFRPFALALCVAAAIAAGVLYWLWQPRIWKRLAAAVAVVVVCVVAGLSRVNMYEIMFHPMGNPAFGSIQQSKLDPAEMVIAVHMKQDARAYPIRIISYHHIVNDVVGGVPIVATY